MVRFFIEEVNLHTLYTQENIKAIFEEGVKLNFTYEDPEARVTKKTERKTLSVTEATEKAMIIEYESIFKRSIPTHIEMITPETVINIWFYNENGYLSLSLSIGSENMFFEDEDVLPSPDSHYYLRVMLNLCKPFCIKSIKTNSQW